MSEQQEWHFVSVVDQQQYGPYSAEQLQEFATTGAVTRETLLWTEGLEEWIPATNVEGLFPGPPVAIHRPTLLTGAAAQAAHPLGATAPLSPAAPQGYQQPVPQALPAGAVPVAAPAAPQVAGIGLAPQAVPRGELYPPPGAMSASFGLLLTLAGLSLVCFIVSIGVAWTRMAAVAAKGRSSLDDLAEAIGQSMLIIGGGLALSLLCILFYRILTLIYLFRAWSAINLGKVRTTPGKAVGFLFIPFYNLYWIFVAYQGLANDWNRVMASHPNLAYAPRLNPGVAVTYCILSVVTIPFAFLLFPLMFNEDGVSGFGMIVMGLFAALFVIELVAYFGICKGVRFMGNLHYAQLQHAAGGLRLY